jgi:hypothetical protein
VDVCMVRRDPKRLSRTALSVFDLSRSEDVLVLHEGTSGAWYI